jgi:hypothetical protein
VTTSLTPRCVDKQSFNEHARRDKRQRQIAPAPGARIVLGNDASRPRTGRPRGVPGRHQWRCCIKSTTICGMGANTEATGR